VSDEVIGVVCVSLVHAGGSGSTRAGQSRE
jgi:hypothetical protein